MKPLNTVLLGERLRVLREEVASSADAFAERAGIPAHTYRRYERGDAERPPFEDMVKIAKELGLTVDEMAELGDMLVLPGDPIDPTEQVLNKIRGFLADTDPAWKDNFLNFYKVITLGLTKELANPPVVTLSEKRFDDFPEAFKKRRGLSPS